MFRVDGRATGVGRIAGHGWAIEGGTQQARPHLSTLLRPPAYFMLYAVALGQRLHAQHLLLGVRLDGHVALGVGVAGLQHSGGWRHSCKRSMQLRQWQVTSLLGHA